MKFPEELNPKAKIIDQKKKKKKKIVQSKSAEKKFSRAQ